MLYLQEAITMTTWVKATKRIIVSFLLLTSVGFGTELISHFSDNSTSFIATAEARRSESDYWREFIRREAQRSAREELNGMRKVRRTQYDIIASNMREENRWKQQVKKEAFFANNSNSSSYGGSSISENTRQWNQRILNQIQSERGSLTGSGVTQHSIRFNRNSDYYAIKKLCELPGSPYRWVSKPIGQNVVIINYDPSGM